MKSLFLFLLNLIQTSSDLADFNAKLNQWKSNLKNSSELAELASELTINESQNLLYETAKRFSQDRKTAEEYFSVIKSLGISFETPPYITKIVKKPGNNHHYFHFEDEGQRDQSIVFNVKTAFHTAIDSEKSESEIKNILESIYTQNKDIDRIYYNPPVIGYIGTPLDLAIQKTNMTAFTTLIALGASVDRVGPRPNQTKLEQTLSYSTQHPDIYPAHYPHQLFCNMTRALIVAGANVNDSPGMPMRPLFAIPIMEDSGANLESAEAVFQSPNLDLTTLIPDWKTMGGTWTLIDFLKENKLSDEIEQLVFGHLEKSLIEQIYPKAEALTPYFNASGVVSLIIEYSIKNKAEDFAKNEKGLLFMHNTFNSILGKSKRITPTATIELPPETASVNHTRNETKPTAITLKK